MAGYSADSNGGGGRHIARISWCGYLGTTASEGDAWSITAAYDAVTCAPMEVHGGTGLEPIMGIAVV